jgi:hypothetical protein
LTEEEKKRWVSEARSAVKLLTEAFDTIVPTILPGAVVYMFEYAAS